MRLIYLGPQLDQDSCSRQLVLLLTTHLAGVEWFSLMVCYVCRVRWAAHLHSILSTWLLLDQNSIFLKQLEQEKRRLSEELEGAQRTLMQVHSHAPRQRAGTAQVILFCRRMKFNCSK